MNKKEQKKLLLSILYTSNCLSRFLLDNLPCSKLAIYYLEIDGSYSKIKREYRQELIGLKGESFGSEAQKFKRKKIVQLISKLQLELTTTRSISSEDQKVTSKFELSRSPEFNEVLLKFHSICEKEIGEKVDVITIPDNLIAKWDNILMRLGKANLKLEILVEAEEEAILNGSYKGFEEFEFVPDACRFYRKKNLKDFDLESEDDIRALKEWINESVIIKKNGEILEDLSTINKRVNAWINHEKNKYNS